MHTSTLYAQRMWSRGSARSNRVGWRESERERERVKGLKGGWFDLIMLICTKSISIVLMMFIWISVHYLSVSKSHGNLSLVKTWTAIDKLSIWKSNLSDKIKCSFFQAAVVSILLYGRTIWPLTKCIEKKLDGTFTRMLQVILNKSSKQYPTKQQLHSHLPLIIKTIQIRQTRHEGHSWTGKDELISDPFLWTFLHGRGGRPSRTYQQQHCADRGCTRCIR